MEVVRKLSRGRQVLAYAGGSSSQVGMRVFWNWTRVAAQDSRHGDVRRTGDFVVENMYKTLLLEK